MSEGLLLIFAIYIIYLTYENLKNHPGKASTKS